MRALFIVLIAVLVSIILLFGDQPNKILAGGYCNERVNLICHVGAGYCAVPATMIDCYEQQ